MIVVGCFYFCTPDDLHDHFEWLQPTDLNLDLLGTTHLDHESKVWELIMLNKSKH